MRISAVLACLLLSSLASAAAQSTTTTVSATPTIAPVGSAVALTANVTASGSASVPGSVTFLDGTTSLGNAMLGSAATIAPKVIPASQLFGASGVLQGTPVTADINGDGKLDVVMYTTSGFQVLVNNGGGSYAAQAVQNDVLSQPAFLDYDHDGKLDIVTLNGTSLQLLKGDGTGTFGTPVTLTGFSTATISINGNTPVGYGSTALAAADVTGDGLPDLILGEVVANPGNSLDPTQAAVSVYRNNGNGTFTLASTTDTGDVAEEGATPKVISIITADLNKDGTPDAIATVQIILAGSSEGIRALVSRGDGTFSAVNAVTTFSCQLSSCVNLTTGDFGGRGRVDIAATRPYVINGSGDHTDLFVLPGNGDGTFASAVPTTTVTQSAPIVVPLDLDGDGKTDLVDAAGYGYISKGDFTFSATTSLTGTPVAAPILASDLNGDGVADVYFTNKTPTPAPVILLGQRGNAAVLTTKTLAAGTHSITAAYAGSGSFTASTSSQVTVTVGQQQPMLTGSSSPNPALVTTPVTLSVTITGPNVMPTGMVTFTQGTTTLGTAALNSSGVASFSYTFPTVGMQTVMANYAGDSNTAAGSVAITATTVAAFTSQPSSGNTSLSTTAGGTATSTIAVTAQNGFSGAVTFACTGLPTGATCSFNPASVTVSGTAAGNTTLTVTTSQTVGMLNGDLFHRGAGVLFAGLLLGCVGFASRRRRLHVGALLVVGMAAGLGVLAGCGGGSGSGSTTTPRTFNFNVVASSGSAQVTTAYTLNIQ